VPVVCLLKERAHVLQTCTRSTHALGKMSSKEHCVHSRLWMTRTHPSYICLLISGACQQGGGRDGVRPVAERTADDDDGAKAAAQQLETGPLAAVDCSVCMCRPVQV